MAQKILQHIRRFFGQIKALAQGPSQGPHDHTQLSAHEKFIHFWILTWRGFTQNRCPVRASALAYTTLLALIPMLAVAASVSTSLLKSKGEEPIENLVEKLVNHIAPQLDLVASSEADAKMFSSADFPYPQTLQIQLRNRQSPLSDYLWEQFSAEAQSVLDNTNASPDLVSAYLAGELNEVLAGPLLFTPTLFTNVVLTEETLAKLDMLQPEQDDQNALIQVNRMLLQDAYPGMITPASGRMRVVKTITHSINKINAGGLGATGMLGLVFVAIMLLSTIEATFNDIWGITHGRGWLTRIVQYWATVTLGPLIPVLAIALNAGSQFESFERFLINQPFVGDYLAVLIPFVVLKVVPFVVICLAFTLFYQLMPNTRVRWQAALVGGLVGGSLWQLNSLIQILYASRVTTYTNIYGPLSLVPIFLVGLYFSWLILLFGAQVAYTFQNRMAYYQDRQSELVNELGREFVALRTVALLAQRFHDGRPPPTEIELGQSLAVPTKLVGDLLSHLVRAGVVLETEGEETGYTVARPLQKLTCHDVLHAVRTGQGKELETKDEPARRLLRAALDKIRRAESSVSNSLTMATLVEEAEKQQTSEPCDTESPNPSKPMPA